jgi:uncharacterized protein
MPRPKHMRHISHLPCCERFRPAGAGEMEEIVLGLDEVEAVRLADLEGLYQADAAERMGISRQTFGRIIETAHRKIARAVVHGHGLVIREGECSMSRMRKFECLSCGHQWDERFGTGRPEACPKCGEKSLRRAFTDEDRGAHRGRGGRPGRQGRGGRCHGRR